MGTSPSTITDSQPVSELASLSWNGLREACLMYLFMLPLTAICTPGLQNPAARWDTAWLLQPRGPGGGGGAAAAAAAAAAAVLVHTFNAPKSIPHLRIMQQVPCAAVGAVVCAHAVGQRAGRLTRRSLPTAARVPCTAHCCMCLLCSMWHREGMVEGCRNACCSGHLCLRCWLHETRTCCLCR